jgi:hypothetical protein
MNVVIPLALEHERGVEGDILFGARLDVDFLLKEQNNFVKKNGYFNKMAFCCYCRTRRENRIPIF